MTRGRGSQERHQRKRMKDKQKARNATERAARAAELCARKTQAWDTEQEAAAFCEGLRREHEGLAYVERYPFGCLACGKWHVSTLSPEEWRSRLAKADPRRYDGG